MSPSALWAADAVPASLDHIILGINDLDHGVAFVEEKTGVRAAFGGVHPGRGTQNALVSLGELHYLEIIAPDPKQELPAWFAELREMREPHLIGWAVHTADIAALAKKVQGAGFAIDGPADGSRARPDGKILHWKSFRLKDDRGGLLPFFIEWGRETVHPSTDAPAGCRLVGFGFQDPKPEELAASLRQLDVDAAVERGEKAQLRARIAGPRGEVELIS